MIRMTTGSGLSFRLTGAVLIATALAGCEVGSLLPKTTTPETASASANPSSKTGEQRDIEAPEIYDISEAGLWDGRPSLGGIWVAHPDVTEPHRVIIRNTANDTSVVGALFRRERDIPGPRIQASSDAAEALAMLPGAPDNLHVTALRREPVIKEAEDPQEDSDSAASAAASETGTTDAPKERKFRWPWAKPQDVTPVEGAIAPLDRPSDISETPLAPIEDSAARPGAVDDPAQTAHQGSTEPNPAALTALSGATPPII